MSIRVLEDLFLVFAGKHGLLVALFAVCLGSLFADTGDEVRALRYKADRAYADARYDEAERHFRSLKKFAKTEAMLMQAGLGLIRSLFAQAQYPETLKVIDTIPKDYLVLPGKGAGGNEQLQRENVLKLEYWRGRVQLAQGDFGKALATLTPATKIKDKNMRLMAHFYVGRCYLAAGKPDNARAQFDILVNAVQFPEEVQAGRVGLLEVLRYEKKWDKLDKLIAEWSQAASGKWDLEMSMLRLRVLLDRKRYIDALTYYRNKLLDVQSEHMNIYEKGHLKVRSHYLVVRLIGRRLTEDERFREAREFYVDLQPRLPYDSQQQEILLDMAASAYHCVVKLKKDKAKKEDVEKWFDLAESDIAKFLKDYRLSALTAKVLYYRGQLYLSANRIEEALTDFQGAYKHAKAPPLTKYESAIQLAQYYLGQKKLDPALIWYHNAAAQNVAPELQARAHFECGMIHDHLGRYKVAASVFNKMVKDYPKLPIVNKARFNEANSAFKAGDYKASAAAFSAFLSSAPKDHELRPRAMYMYGVVLRWNEQWNDSEKTLLDFVKLYPKNKMAPMALLEAAETAHGVRLYKRSVDHASRVIVEYPESDEVPRALYHRIYYSLFLGLRPENALVDEKMFFDPKKSYAVKHPDLAAQILMWFGGFFYGKQDFMTASKYYERVVKEFGKSHAMPEAQYECAKCFYKKEIKNDGKDFSRPTKMLDDLLNNVIAKQKPIRDLSLLARANLLAGDIRAIEGKYVEAERFFAKCTEAMPGTSTYYQGLIRRGDMKYSQLGSVKEPAKRAALEGDAVKFYSLVVNGNPFNLVLREKALYRRGLVRMRQKNELEGIKDLSRVMDMYIDKKIKGQEPDCFHFIKAGQQLQDHYAKTDRVRKAIDVLKRIEKEDTPFKKWAGKRIKELEGEAPKSAPKPKTPELQKPETKGKTAKPPVKKVEPPVKKVEPLKPEIKKL